MAARRCSPPRPPAAGVAPSLCDRCRCEALGGASSGEERRRSRGLCYNVGELCIETSCLLLRPRLPDICLLCVVVFDWHTPVSPRVWLIRL